MLSLLMAPTLALAVGSPAGHPTSSDDWTIHAERVYTGPGEVLEDAVITVKDGVVASITPGGKAPEDALAAHAVTAGMIDLSAHLADSRYAVEQAREVQPHLSVAPAVDLYSTRWKALAASGVTIALVSPLDLNIIGGHGIALRTAGPKELAAREVTGKPVLRGAIGTQPSGGNHPAYGRPTDFFSRRPTTRMGVEWEWRIAFFDAVAATRLPEKEFPGAEELRAALRGERVVMIQAWATQDIRTAVFLKEEMSREGFGELDLVLDAAAEAWKEPQLLMRSGTTVVLPPFPAGGRTTDQAFMAWNTAKLLTDGGVTVCLSSHGRTSAADRLSMQAGFAMRGGLTFDQALAAVTTNPAQVLGISERVGTVESGKDADLVLWSGQPFEPSARITGVLVAGELALDPR